MFQYFPRSFLRIGIVSAQILWMAAANAARQSGDSVSYSASNVLVDASLEVRSRIVSQEKRDYAEIKKSAEWSRLQSAVRALAEIAPDELDSPNSRRAFWINV